MVPASSSSRTRAVPDAPRAPVSSSTPTALRSLIPGRGTLRGVYLKRIASSHLYQGFYPSPLSPMVMFSYQRIVVSFDWS